jgi:succinate dehydrogenase/fumarate reductase flavoprotein subunit
MIESHCMETDIFIIGGGIAGIRAAIEASQQGTSVLLANKGYLGQDGAVVWMAGGGYQVALNPPDSIDQHIRDTIKAGKYLNNQNLVQLFLNLAPESVHDLDRWGVRWKKEGGKYPQIRMPGETHPRSMLHTKTGEHFGGEYRKALPRRIRREKNVTLLHDTFVIDLLKNGEAVVGAVCLDIKEGEFRVVRAKSTILATGGFMDCFEFSTANPTATGDGHGIACRAGARMIDMEFIQFFPAAALWPANVYGDAYSYALIYELYGILYNRLGERFMERYFPVEKDFATRQAQSRAIAREVREGRGSPHGGAYLSFRHMPRNLLDAYLRECWNVPFFQSLREAGVDIREDAIEIGPAAHYVQGGCWVNELCETNLPGLYAAGEVGSGGKDGADRLAGNALPFCMAMGYVAGKEAAHRAKAITMPKIDEIQAEAICNEALAPLERKEGIRPTELKKRIRRLMSRCMMFERTGEELEKGIKEVESMRNEMLPRVWSSVKIKRFNLEWLEILEVRNMVDIAEMAMRSALMRTESRGLHERADFPNEDPLWLKHIIVSKKDNGLELATEPVVFTLLEPPESSKT